MSYAFNKESQIGLEGKGWAVFGWSVSRINPTGFAQ
jgi:hypothetical protein